MKIPWINGIAFEKQWHRFRTQAVARALRDVDQVVPTADVVVQPVAIDVHHEVANRAATGAKLAWINHVDCTRSVVEDDPMLCARRFLTAIAVWIGRKTRAQLYAVPVEVNFLISLEGGVLHLRRWQAAFDRCPGRSGALATLSDTLEPWTKVIGSRVIELVGGNRVLRGTGTTERIRVDAGQ